MRLSHFDLEVEAQGVGDDGEEFAALGGGSSGCEPMVRVDLYCVESIFCVGEQWMAAGYDILPCRYFRCSNLFDCLNKRFGGTMTGDALAVGEGYGQLLFGAASSFANGLGSGVELFGKFQLQS